MVTNMEKALSWLAQEYENFGIEHLNPPDYKALSVLNTTLIVSTSTKRRTDMRTSARTKKIFLRESI